MITRASNIQLFKFWLFNFSNFQTTFVKNFMKKLPGFEIYFESTYNVLPLHQYLRSEISRQRNNGLLNYFFKFTEKSVSLLKFCQMREILKPPFYWLLLKCIAVSYSNGNENFTGCFQITGRWICYYIFPISHL